jgi:hypothetical protein
MGQRGAAAQAQQAESGYQFHVRSPHAIHRVKIVLTESSWSAAAPSRHGNPITWPCISKGNGKGELVFGFTKCSDDWNQSHT